MSINKNAYIRYQTLDKCFSNTYRAYYIEDLLEQVNNALEDFNGYDSNIRKRQLFDDIKFMESEAGWSIPLERVKSGKKVSYRYSEKGFSIKKQKISDEELDAINSALMVLLRFKGIPQFEWVNELIPKLQSLFKQENIPEVISFDHNEFLKGLDFLPKLYQCIINKIPVEIEYKSFKNVNPKMFIIHPYYLKQYNKRWFLFGISESDQFLYNLALDRIVSVENSANKFIKNSSFDFADYFENIVGVSRGRDEQPLKITLLFDSDTAQYVLTKPIHGSQRKMSHDDSGLLIEIEVIPNFELRQMILSFGNGVKVISPEKFRNEIADTINKMHDYYS
jgi:predicted DNA-binding transcriptional regulator YafY